jgi:hypothetical protein
MGAGRDGAQGAPRKVDGWCEEAADYAAGGVCSRQAAHAQGGGAEQRACAVGWGWGELQLHVGGCVARGWVPANDQNMDVFAQENVMRVPAWRSNTQAARTIATVCGCISAGGRSVGQELLWAPPTAE